MELRAIGDWLLEKDAQAQNALRYYLGPAYEPINALAQFGALMSPGADMMDMAQSSDALMHSPTWKDAGLNALGLGAATLGAFIPGTARGITEAVDTAADSTRKGIRAYHGSPHDFDKFSLDKIGTGEGAQAYGHGLYFAENEGVAKAYRDAISKKASADPFRVTARSILAKYGGDKEKALAHLRRSAEAFGDTPRGNSFRYAADALEDGASIEDVAGRMYEVNINADPADFLDWDKPLSEQPAGRRLVDDFEAKRQRALASVPEVEPGMNFADFDAANGPALEEAARYRIKPEWTGGQLYESSRLVPGDFRDKEAAAAALREAGIPGIKYLDQGSRAAGEGSRNYVVFDDNLISILRKYGLLGMIGGGAAATAASQNYGDGA